MIVQFIDRLNQDYALDYDEQAEEDNNGDTRKQVSEFVLLEKRPEPFKD